MIKNSKILARTTNKSCENKNKNKKTKTAEQEEGKGFFSFLSSCTHHFMTGQPWGE